MASSEVGSSNQVWFNNFVSTYYNNQEQLLKWSISPQTYAKSISAPSILQPFILYLSNCYMVRDELIAHWRFSTEWPESMENNRIVYYFVHLLLSNTTSYIPPDAKMFLTERTRSLYDEKTGETINLRKEYLREFYIKTSQNIHKLNDLVLRNESLISDVFRGANKKIECPASLSIENVIENTMQLYNSDKSVIIFSGVSEIVCSNDQISAFINQSKPPIFTTSFFTRSWTLDLRVAIYFSQNRNMGDRGHRKVIFMMRTDRVCYISPATESWEAEVFKPAGDYIYEEHFEAPYKEFISSQKQQLNRKWDWTSEVVDHICLVIVIKKITYKEIDPMTENNFNRYIDTLYTESGLVDEDTQGDQEYESSFLEDLRKHQRKRKEEEENETLVKKTKRGGKKTRKGVKKPRKGRKKTRKGVKKTRKGGKKIKRKTNKY
jgi:hypothetical protein